MSKSDVPLQKHTLNLYKGDAERLAALAPEIPWQTVLREIVHKFIEDNEVNKRPKNLKLEIAP